MMTVSERQTARYALLQELRRCEAALSGHDLYDFFVEALHDLKTDDIMVYDAISENLSDALLTMEES